MSSDLLATEKRIRLILDFLPKAKVSAFGTECAPVSFDEGVSR